MKTIFAFLVLLFLPCLCSAETAITTTVYTRHFNYRPELNENNYLIGVKYNNFFGVTFENSNYDRTYFFGYMLSTERKYFWNNSLYINGNLYVGVSYGYEIDISICGWYPAVAPTFEVGIDKASLELLAWPTDGGVAVLLFNYKF